MKLENKFQTHCPFNHAECIKEPCMLYNAVTSEELVQKTGTPLCLLHQALFPLAEKAEKELLARLKGK